MAAFKFAALFLVFAVCGSLVAGAKAPGRLSCNNKSVCWDHQHANHGRTCAHLQCGDRETTLYIEPQSTDFPRIHHNVDIAVVDKSGQAYPGRNCQKRFNTAQDLSSCTVGGGGPVNIIPVGGIEPGYNDPIDLNSDYADMIDQPQNAPAFDMNAEYAQMWQAMSGRQGIRAQCLALTVSDGECSSGRAVVVQQSRDDDCTRYPRSQRTFLVKEYFRVAGTPVDLATFTEIEVECSVCVNKPTGEFEPTIKPLSTAQCRKSGYICPANIPTPPGSNIHVEFKEDPRLPHPYLDTLVSWQVAELVYGRDKIIDRKAITAVGNEIGTTLRPSGTSPAFFSIRTDNVVEENTLPPRLTINCAAEYCYNQAVANSASPRVNTCSTPRC